MEALLHELSKVDLVKALGAAPASASRGLEGLRRPMQHVLKAHEEECQRRATLATRDCDKNLAWRSSQFSSQVGDRAKVSEGRSPKVAL
jgi:hypothetical protein